MKSANPTHIYFGLFFSLLSLVIAPLIVSASDANMSVTIERMDSRSSMVATIILSVITLALIIVLILLIRYIMTEKRKKRALKEKVERMDTDEAEYVRENIEDFREGGEEKPVFDRYSDVDKYLKDDEKRIVEILRQREGICSQATLRIVGNFSKATLSRILKELEERNVIKKEQRGKKNLVILK